MDSGNVTGWPDSEWVEDIMLLTQSPSGCDQWVSNETPFNDPNGTIYFSTSQLYGSPS